MTQQQDWPLCLAAGDAPERPRPILSPAPIAARLAGRTKRPLGDAFGLRAFGVNFTRLEPGAQSALLHAHALQDEFVYILRGHPRLVTSDGEVALAPGMCAGFRAGTGRAHHLVNPGPEVVEFLEVGTREAGDEVTYPDDDLAAHHEGGQWVFTHKDGTPYDR